MLRKEKQKIVSMGKKIKVKVFVCAINKLQQIKSFD
jgi:hypothetical protein